MKKTVNPIDVPCPLCGASTGKHCTTASGMAFHRVGIPGLSTHVARNKAAEEATKLAKQLPRHHKPEEPMESVVQDGLDHPPYRLEGWTVEDIPRAKSYAKPKKSKKGKKKKLKKAKK